MTNPILVVGAGPTGLTAALELSRQGVPVRLIDKRAGPAETSRAIGIQARTLELMEQRGLADEMVRLGNKGHAGSVYGGGRRVLRLDFGHVPSRYDYMLFLSQAETERILREACARHGVEPEWRTTLTGIAQDALSRSENPVAAAIGLPDGATERFETPWLISAEGAHSLTRTTLDLRFGGRSLDTQYALGDLHLDGDLPGTDFHIFSSEHGFMGLFPMGGRHFRLIASNPFGKPDPHTRPSLDEFQKIYDQRSHIPARFHDLVWSSWFRINSRMIERLRVGRILFGGDAAHIHSPAGAQGMNTGIQDMINLCWKLALVQRGGAPPALLDTYEQDRLPVMRNVLFGTEHLTEIIGSENPVTRTLFNHLGPWIGGTSIVQENSTARMAQIALGYRDSPLSDEHAHSGSLKAGDRMPPQLRVRRAGTGGDTDLAKLLDPSSFVLVVAHGATPVAVTAALTAAAGGIPIVEIAAAGDDDRDYAALLGGRSDVYLVRPDGYVGLAASARGAPAALAAYVSRWLTHEEPSA
ncbi:FAD-dependent oxidoreductase [Roseomonas sp. NAR14]|uniref:FAD-dependent oxidoreductase n=1 Tax=Roseomonas acroporae TaxID=2937791 RepID=A0A9X2C046_9PROT|nr:FAD-dependent oxidoreductase [Roseomonas acroporae]MCK8787755.1 FAD-dependent oxidoreductase [Roseomonas acroporae]